MKSINSSFSVKFNYNVYFTNGLFNKNNQLLLNILNEDGISNQKKVLFVVDDGVANHFPDLSHSITEYFKANHILLVDEPYVIPGGEKVKNDPTWVDKILNKISKNGICRHSFVAVIGGGAVIDAVGFAAAIAHRGVRLIRIPTTVLSQNDSGIGVKNSINAFNKKNFTGTFAPPFAVINDFDFLMTLTERDWRSGIAEALKVALIKDQPFFDFIKDNAALLSKRNLHVMQILIYKCARLHINHISGLDPFETGSSRPLDFGHWAAHKLEQISNYNIRHGEAVATGIAVDVTYSYLIGLLPEKQWKSIIELISRLGFKPYLPELSHYSEKHGQLLILNGLDEFREHLGGLLSITLLEDIGKGIEVHEMDRDVVLDAINLLKLHYNKIKSPKEHVLSYEL